MDARYQLRLFGAPALLGRDGAEILLRTRKQYALVLYLTLEGQARPVHRDRLAELIWPDVSAARGRHSLSQAITELRERLGADLFSRGGNTLRLEAPIATELELVTKGRLPAVPLGPLVGVDEWAGTEFAHWADAARERIVRRVVDVLQAAVLDHRRAGHLREAHDAAGILYALDPFSELAVHTLAEQALVQGESVNAIQLLRRHVARVAEELQCEPQPKVSGLLRRLEAGEPQADARPTVPPVSAPTQVEFIGRHHELATLEGLWEQARSGSLRACLLSGAGGIGKSALLRRYSTGLLARGAPVFSVSCQEIGAGIPYSAVADLITALARDPGMAATSPLLLSEVTRIVPSLRVRYPGIPLPDPTAPEAIKIRLSEALSHIVENIGDGSPLAIAIDDIQHIDPASRDLLFLLQRRMAGLPVFLVAACRSTGSRTSEPSSAEGLVWQVTVGLEPLSQSEASDLVQRLCADSASPPPAVASKIVELGGGNPSFIELLVADWRSHTRSSVVQVALQTAPPERDWQPPRDLRIAFARQFERTSEVARSILHILATARRRIATDQLTSLIGCQPGETHRALLELSAAGLTQPTGSGAAFKNDLHRAYVYYSMDASVRQWYHSRLAAELASGDQADRGLAIEIGTHHLEAGQSAFATVPIIKGAREAITVGAYGEAEAALRRLLPALGAENKTLANVLSLLGESLRGQGKYREVLQLLDDYEGVIHDRDSVPGLLVLRAEAMQRNHDRTDSEVSEAAAQALELTRASTDQELYLRALQTAAESVSETASAAGLRAIEREALELTRERQSSDIRARALMTTGYCQLSIHACDAAATSFRASAACFSGRGRDNERMRVLNGLAAALVPTGRFAEALTALSESLSIAVQVDDKAHCATVFSNLGTAYEWMARFGDASLLYAMARDIAGSCGISRKIVEVYLNSFDLSLLSGDFGKAESFLRTANEAADATGSARLRARVLLASADLQIAIGEPEFAWPLVVEAARISGCRGWALDNSGRYDRLVEHFEHATGQRIASEQSPGRTPACQIEVLAVREQLAGGDNRGAALLMAESHGLYGVIGRLAAVRIYAGGDPTDSSTTGVRYVEEIFQDQRRATDDIPGVDQLLGFVRQQYGADRNQAALTLALPRH